jgi:hypothetical protein
MARVRLNGWQRLWIVTSIIAGVVLAMMCSAREFSAAEAHVMKIREVRTATENVTKEANRAMAAVPPGPSRDAVQAQYQSTLNKQIAGIEESIEFLRKNEEAQLPRRYSQFFAAWVALTIGSYATGWIAAWVYRGFRPHAKSAS